MKGIVHQGTSCIQDNITTGRAAMPRGERGEESGFHRPSLAFLWMAVFPMCILAAAAVLEYSGLDLWWEAQFYDRAAGLWPYRDHWFFEGIIHNGGRQLNICAAGIWLTAFVSTIVHKPFRQYRNPMVYFLAAAAAGPLIVGALKQVTHIYTPWDIEQFSGPFPHIRLFDPVPEGLPSGGAFPAGHSSGGFAYLSLYFLLHHLRSPHKAWGLLPGLILGGVFGLGQQVRGAHFPSHDLFSMVICWYAAFLLYYLLYPKQWRLFFHE